MKFELSACILVRASSQLLVSVLFIDVPANTQNLKFFLHSFIIVAHSKLATSYLQYACGQSRFKAIAFIFLLKGFWTSAHFKKHIV